MKDSKILAVVLSGMICLWGIIVFYIALSALPFNPIQLPGSRHINIRTLVPEGWGFFTRNPQEPYLNFLKKGLNGWATCLSIPNSSSSNFFGIKRNARAEGIEYSFLIKNILPEQWQNSERGIVEYKLYDSLTIFEVTNKIHSPQICGDILVVQQEYVPWAWSASGKAINMPVKFVRLKVKCERLKN